MAGIKFDITGDNRNVLQSFGEVQSGVKQMQRQVEESGSSIEDMFKRIGAAAGIAFSFQEAKAFVGKVVEMRSFFQDIESSMKVFLGNEKKAAEFTQQLKDYAYYNMFEFKDLADASQQMIAYGHDIDTIIPKLDQLSNIAVGTHGNLMDLVAIYNKAKSTGVVDAQGIQSWAVKGVVIKDVLKQMGEEASGTAVTFEQLNKVLDHVTGEGGMFHNLQLEMMENISAEIGQFEDNFNAMLNEIGEKYQDTIISGIKIGSEIIDNYQTLAKYIQDAVVAYGLYKTALMTANALDKARTVGLFALTTAEKVHYGALVLEEKAQALLNKTIMANPYVLATMAVAGLAFGIYKLATAEDAETAARRRANEQMDEFKGKLEEQKSRITSYIQTVQDANATDYEKALAWENLSKEAPTLTNAYTQAEVAAMDFGDAQKHINDIMDEAEYSQTIQQVKQWEAEVKKANDALNAFGGGGLIEKLTKVFQEKDLNAAIAGLREARKALEEIENRRKEIAEKNKPIEIRVKEANENTESKQAILNFYDRAISLAHEVETAINEQDYSKAVQNFDDYVVIIEKEVKDLKEKSEQNPIDMKLKLAAEEKQKMLDELIQMRNGFISMGVTQIPFTIRMNYEKAKNGADAAKEGKDGMHWVEDMVSLAGGHWEADTPTIVKTSAEWQKELRKNLTAAKKELSDFEQGKGKYKDKKYTKEERDNERKRLDAAVSAAKKALGSDPTKRENKEENERIRRMKALQKFNDLLEKQKQENARAAVDIQHSTTQAEIDAMEDGNDKTMRQIQLDFEKRKTEIERAYEDLKQKKIDEARKLWEANPANKGKLFDESSVDTSYSDAETQNYRAQLNANLEQYKRSKAELAASELQDLYNYLKEYGTIEQQRYAITKEYDEKIAKEKSDIRKKALEAEKKSALSSVNAQSLAMSIDWNQTFSGIGNVLEGIAKETLSKVKEYMKTDEYKGLGAADKKSYQDLVSQLQQAGGIEGKSPLAASTWNDIGKLTEQYKQRVKDFLAAQETHKNAVEMLISAEKELAEATTPTAQAVAQMKVDLAKQAVEESAGTVESTGAAKDEANQNLHTATDAATKGLQDFQTTLGNLTSGTLSGFANGVAGVINSLTSKTGKAADGLVGALGSKTGGLIGAILQIVDALGDDPAGFITSILDKVADVIDKILSTLLTEIVPAVLEGVANIIGSIIEGVANLVTFGAVGSIFGGKGHEEEYKKELEDWKSKIEANTYAVEQLTEKMNDKTNSPSDAARERDAALSALKGQIASNRGSADLVAGDSDKGYHSWYYKRNDAGFDYNRFNSVLAQHGSTTRVGSAGDVVGLSAKDIQILRTYAGQAWADYFGDVDSERNPTEVKNYLEAIGDLAEKDTEIISKFYATLTNMSFDDLRSDFKSKMMDMKSDAKDFTDDFAKMMTDSLMDSFMATSGLNEAIKQWQIKWGKALENDNTLSEAELNDLRREYEALVKQAMEVRDQAAQITGYADTYEQEASSKGFNAMSQDLGEELSGRFTAVQIAGENISAQMLVVVATMNSLASFSGSTNGAVLEIRNMMIMTNSYLEDVVKYAKLLYREFGEKLDDIVNNTKNL